MSVSPLEFDPDHHSDDALTEVDALCDDFEESWLSGEKKTLEAMLATATANLRDVAFSQLLGVEVELLHRDGQLVHASTYAQRFPDMTEIISRHFKTADETVQMQTAATVSVAPADAATTLADSVPFRLGRYILEGELGRGGMGAVYLARDTTLDRDVALKIPRFSDNVGPDLIDRFYREAKAMAAIRHRNLCVIHDVSKIDEFHCLTMELIAGETLAQKITRESTVTATYATRLVAKLCGAVQLAHDAGVVHRDLKPGNVMIDQSDEPVIMDFGLARRKHSQDAKLTDEGVIIGSPAYMAPEQMETFADDIGPQSDVYSLGVILYELLCGQTPYEGSALSVLAQLATKDPRPVSEIKPDIDGELADLCMKAISRSLDERYASAAEFEAALKQWQTKAAGEDSVKDANNEHRVRNALFFGGVLMLLIAMAVYVFRTPTRVVTVTMPNGANVAVEIRQNGKIVEVIDREAGWTARIVDGEYEVALRPVGHSKDVEFTIAGGNRLTVSSSESAAIVVEVADIDRTKTTSQSLQESPFTESEQEFLVSGARRAQFGDVDGDGDQDVVFAGTTDESGQIWLNDGAGKFAWKETSLPKAWRITLHDIDNDGDVDAWLSGGSDPDQIYQNDGSGHFVKGEFEAGECNGHDVAFADFDGDGDDDAFVANGVFQNKFKIPRYNQVYINDGSGKFKDSGQQLGQGSTIAAVALDADGDGDIDICAGNTSAAKQDSRIWLNDGHGVFAEGQSLENNGLAPAVGDIDNDGDVDLVIGRGITTNSVWMNKGTGKLVATGQGFEHSACLGLILNDVDADGDLDAILSNRMRDRVTRRYLSAPNTVWWNNGQGEYLSSAQLPGKYVTSDLAAADIDGDGDVDLLEVPYFEGPCRLLLGRTADQK